MQGFKLSDNRVLDLGVDSTKTLVDPGVRVFDPDRELAAGSLNEDFAAYYVGATYNGNLWSANGRLEIRDADSQDRVGLLAGWYREPSLGHSMSAGFTLLDNQLDTGEESRSATLKYGWAWRKADSRWSFLNRIDLVLEELTLITQSQENYRLINNFNANRRISARSQLSLQYAFKYVRGTFDVERCRGHVRPQWHRAQINSSVTNESSEFGPRLFSNIGLVQGFKLSDNRVLDLGVDSTKTLVDPGVRVFDPDRELAAGSLNEDFAAYYVGATYNGNLWSANGRLEIRDADSQDRVGLLAGWYREPSLGHSMSAGFTLLDNQLDTGEESRSATLKYGWAWRKADSRWSFLNRIDLVLEELTLITQSQENYRLINNFNANRRISARSQLSLQYAFKYVRGTFDGAKISGYTDLIGVDYRHGFSARWDAGAHTSVYQSHKSSVTNYGFGLDVGFKLRDNLWATIGYNLIGFHDDDFSEARYTAQGPFLRFTIKADQHTLKKIAGGR